GQGNEHHAPDPDGRDRRDEGREALAEQDLAVGRRGGQQRLQAALDLLPDQAVGGDGDGQDRRGDGEEEEERGEEPGQERGGDPAVSSEAGHLWQADGHAERQQDERKPDTAPGHQDAQVLGGDRGHVSPGHCLPPSSLRETSSRVGTDSVTNCTCPPASTIARTSSGLSRSGSPTGTVRTLPATATSPEPALRAASATGPVTSASRTTVALPHSDLRSSSGDPTAISRFARTPTRSQTRLASSRAWALRTIGRLSRRSSSRKSRTVLAPSGSRLAVGSSRNSTGGSWISARARASRCRIPLE